MEKDYVLRENDKNEISRLKFQHQVWKEETNFAITRAKVFDGENIIDLGCGPGYLSYDLLELIGENGKIYCVDNSDLFVKHVEKQGFRNIQPVKLDIRNGLSDYFSLADGIDKVFCRWVLMFVSDIEKIIAQTYQLLKPGGKFVSMEYFNFKHISMFPQCDSFDKTFQNVWKLLRQNGGNPDVGNDIHQIMQKTGFKNIELYPIYKTGKVNSPTWKWLEQTNSNHKNLVDSGLITQKELDDFYADWKQKSASELSFISAPPLMITIGEK
jgi:ubiquinone/menaquinone biosynthesis C-methylase UbiE